MSKVEDLKELLLDTLVSQISNGVKIATKDGEILTVDAGAPTLAVAAKVIKDWAGDIENTSKAAQDIEKLSGFLKRHKPDLAEKLSPN